MPAASGTQQLASGTPSGGSASTYSYDTANNMTQLAGSGPTSLTYNPDSELEGGPLGTYAFNLVGERTSLTPTSGTPSDYTYNANQDLASATVPAGTVSYTYNGNEQLMSSTTGANTTNFSWDDTGSMPVLLSAGNESYIYGPNGNAVEQISGGGTVQYLHHDQIGSIRLITNASGSVVGTFTFTPYGSPLGSSGSVTSLIGYAGQYTDPNTGLTYNQARWYDPTTGSLMSVDPRCKPPGSPTHTPTTIHCQTQIRAVMPYRRRVAAPCNI